MPISAWSLKLYFNGLNWNVKYFLSVSRQLIFCYIAHCSFNKEIVKLLIFFNNPNLLTRPKVTIQ